MFFDAYKHLCKEVNKSPNAVAKELGFASSSVTQWKHGSTPRPDSLQKIADYFQVPVRYFITGEMDEKKPASGEAGGLSEGVMELIGLYDQGSPEYQAELLGYARGLAAARKSLGIEKEGK